MAPPFQNSRSGFSNAVTLKNTDPVFGKKQKNKKNNNSVSTRLKVRFVVLAAECEANCHSLLTRGIFFFPCCQPHCSISVPIPSDTACLLNHTLGPMRVCPHQTLSVFTSAQGDISVTTCFTLASQLFPLQLLRSTAAAGLR